MKMKHYILPLLCTILFWACKDGRTKATEAEGETYKDTNLSEPHWAYQGEMGPEHWAEIEKESDCDGLRQSPINIIDVDTEITTSLSPIEIYYATDVKIHDVTNNGHSIQYNFEKGDYIVIEGIKYALRQIHFHEASEHTINGVRYPLEMHLVHFSEERKDFAVLAVMAIEGHSSAPFNFLEQYLPLKTGETKSIDANFDLNLNLPDNRSYYTYKGSLTTPPCTEKVNWYIFNNPITVSLEQVKELQKLMPMNNYRNEQPLNGRKILNYSTE